MTSLYALPSIIHRRKKRLGQGLGSGKGKTAGRGTKGQKARGKSPGTIGERGSLFLRRLPLYRGKFRNKPVTPKPVIINLNHLAVFSKGAKVDINALVALRIISADMAQRVGVKVLGDGELTVPLTVHLRASAQAKKKIEKSGGTVVILK